MTLQFSKNKIERKNRFFFRFCPLFIFLLLVFLITRPELMALYIASFDNSFLHTFEKYMTILYIECLWSRTLCKNSEKILKIFFTDLLKRKLFSDKNEMVLKIKISKVFRTVH